MIVSNVLKAVLLILAMLSLIIPFILSGDKTLTTLTSYTVLASLTIVLAQAYLRRWVRT